MNKVSRFLALPILSAGILAGALGAAGAAGATVTTTTTTNGSHAIVSSPDTKANNQTMHPYWQRHRSHNNYWRH